MEKLGDIYFKMNGRNEVVKTSLFYITEYEGFSFVVDSELDAYKAAYYYKSMNPTINKAAIQDKWTVFVENKDIRSREAIMAMIKGL